MVTEGEIREFSDELDKYVEETLAGITRDKVKTITSKKDYFALWDDVMAPIREMAYNDLEWRKSPFKMMLFSLFLDRLDSRFVEKIEAFNPSFQIPWIRIRGVVFYYCSRCGRIISNSPGTYRKYCPYCLPFIPRNGKQYTVRTLKQKIMRDEEKKKRKPRFCKNPQCHRDITSGRTDKEYCSKKCLMAVRRKAGLG